HVVFEHHALVDRNVVLNLHVVADLGPGHHDDVLAQAAALPDHGARHHVTEVPDLGVPADPCARIDVARLVDEVVGHQPTTLASSTITVPRLDDRYLYEICLRGSCLILPLASITVTSVTTSANSAPWQPAFM